MAKTKKYGNYRESLLGRIERKKEKTAAVFPGEKRSEVAAIKE